MPTLLYLALALWAFYRAVDLYRRRNEVETWFIPLEVIIAVNLVVGILLIILVFSRFQ